jgi:hypothetical protein
VLMRNLARIARSFPVGKDVPASLSMRAFVRDLSAVFAHFDLPALTLALAWLCLGGEPVDGGDGVVVSENVRALTESRPLPGLVGQLIGAASMHVAGVGATRGRTSEADRAVWARAREAFLVALAAAVRTADSGKAQGLKPVAKLADIILAGDDSDAAKAVAAALEKNGPQAAKKA